MDEMKPSRGYYSILQFVPDPERAEGANIGIGDRNKPGADQSVRASEPGVDFIPGYHLATVSRNS